MSHVRWQQLVRGRVRVSAAVLVQPPAPSGLWRRVGFRVEHGRVDRRERVGVAVGRPRSREVAAARVCREIAYNSRYVAGW